MARRVRLLALATTRRPMGHNLPVPLWGKSFDDFVETSLDPTTCDTYRHISRSSFRTLDDLGISMPTTALLIRDEYEKLSVKKHHR